MKVSATLKAFGIALSLTMLCSMTSAASRDWKRYPAVPELNTKEDVFAIGDVHGDRKRLKKVLLKVGLIAASPNASDQVRWVGGKSVLVVVGDLIDKGSKSLEVIELLRKLQRDAESDGGRIIILMGNHEAEFLAFPKEPEFLEIQKDREFFNQLKDPTEVANCKGDLGQFLCNLPIAVRVNDWFFSHGGNTHEQTIAELSAAIKDAVNSERGFASEELIGKNSILEARLNKRGPKHLPWIYDGNKKPTPRSPIMKQSTAEKNCEGKRWRTAMAATQQHGV